MPPNSVSIPANAQLLQRITEQNALIIDLHRKQLKHLRHLENIMATVAETLAKIDTITNTIAADVAAERTDIAAVKVLIQQLKDAATTPAVEAMAQAALDKLTGVEGDLKSTETDLNAVGKTTP